MSSVMAVCTAAGTLVSRLSMASQSPRKAKTWREMV